MPRPRHVVGQALLAFLSLAVLLPLYFISQVPGGGDRAGAARRGQALSHRNLPKRIILAAPAFALLLAMYLLGLGPGDSSASAGPVRIEGVSIWHLPQASSPRIEVALQLKNHDSVAHEVQAWWLLARPGASRPWEVYAFRSSTQGPHTVAPGEELKLNWWEQVATEPGNYELSVWVHTVESDGARHSDGARVEDPIIRIDSPWSPLIRRATPPPGLQVSTVDLPAAARERGLPTPAELPVTIGVRNDTAVETQADIQWFLYRKASRLPWNAKPAYTSRLVQHQALAANSETSIRASEPISLWPGEYLLRVVIREAKGTEDGAGSDDAFLTDAVKVLENNSVSGIIRADAAPGPVEIEKLTVDIGSFQTGNGSVTVSLRNQGAGEQDVVLWWFLGRPGSLEPWVEFDIQSQVYASAIGPGRTSIIDLSDEALAPPGTYELSVWVHTQDGQGEELPSDGAWFNRLVEIQ